jgi:very-short-patch-repair endonuclease
MDASDPDDRALCRRRLVDQARRTWSERLIDVSRRNPLLYFRELKAGTLVCRPQDPRVFDRFLAGQAVEIPRLAGVAPEDPTAWRDVLARARAIRRKALENREERGVHTCHLAVGLASWRETGPDAERPPRAPVFLVPVALETLGTDLERTVAQRQGEITVNPVLLQVLRRSFGVTFEAPSAESADGISWAALVEALAQLPGQLAEVPGFGVRPDVVLGNFAFQKLAMVRDLEEWAPTMAEHDLVAALAGDPAARAAVLASRAGDDAEGAAGPLDDLPPEDEFQVLDADASQVRVIRAAVRGLTGLIQGPPGTGKSQTIANVIAELAARGRRILFVAEKRAALEVVRTRLERTGLGHLVLDLHGADVSRKAVMQRIAAGLESLREAVPVDAEALHRELSDRRAALNQHVRRLHEPAPPASLSPYELMGHLLRLRLPVDLVHRWRGPALERLTTESVAELADRFAAAGTFAGLLSGRDASPWARARLADGEAVNAAVDLVNTLALSDWPEAERLFERLHGATGLPLPRDVAAADATADLVQRTAAVLRVLAPTVFGPDLAAAAAVFARVSDRANWLTRLFDRAFRTAERTMRRHQRVRTTLPELSRLVREAAWVQAGWAGLAGPGRNPVGFADAEDLATTWTRTRAGLLELARLIALLDPDTLPWAQWRDLFDALRADASTPHRLPRLHALVRAIDEAQGGPLLTELVRRNVAPEHWADACRWVWYRSCLDACLAGEPLLGGFDGREHDRIVRDFGRLDRQRLEVARLRVRRAHAEQAVAAFNAHPDEAQLVRREAAKRTRHRPLRALLEEAPHVLTALFPCWMASPLSISQLLPAARLFDVVLFDEASQLLPEDAVPALLRGRQAVVAGDRHQLPPTTFFAADEEGEDAPETISGFESLFDLMAGFLTPWSLEWHYRSRDERLIAFSNHHIYQGRLITFPGPGGDPVISHHLVPHVVGQDDDRESSSAEVRQVVDLVFEQARRRPDESLGVITMGIRHANRIQAALDERLRAHPEVAPFFAENRPERFFVKNLERVQGDERDTIILSIGYGKDRLGRLPHRFGPLNQEGGERRLNVAVTRARRRLVVVSSFDHRDIDPDRSAARGVGLLRAFLEYAASGGRGLEPETGGGVPLNPFEADVYDALTARGLRLVPQYGVSRYRLDFAVQHPRQPGRFVLAVECDGETYHSAPAARDRDRLRQQQLEALGWRFCRIWSIDWFMRREQEIERVLAAYEDALRAADAPRPKPDGWPPASPAPPAPAPRGPRPLLPVARSIDDYAPADLERLVAWILSDGILRDDDAIVSEMVRELGFRRRGARIEAAIRDALERHRRRARTSPRPS